MEPLRTGDPAWVGGYRLIARLGGGGMGTVFLARNTGGRPVAVKLIRAELADDQQFRLRFRLEVAAAQRIGGHWTPPVLGADTGAWRPWVATDYVPGPDLAAAVRQFGVLPEATVRVLGAGLAEGLKAVHASGLAHRDVKPSNVLLAVDGPRLIDFGIARALDADGSPLARTGDVISSPGFMAPEQVDGRGAEPASDVFSLGAVLAFAATGRAPFGRSANAAAVMLRILREDPDLDGVPRGLREAVAACLDKIPANRPTPDRIRELLESGPALTATRADRAGWLPQEVSGAVAQVAAELLRLEAPPDAPPQAAPQGPPPASPMAWRCRFRRSRRRSGQRSL